MDVARCVVDVVVMPLTALADDKAAKELAVAAEADVEAEASTVDVIDDSAPEVIEEYFPGPP